MSTDPEHGEPRAAPEADDRPEERPEDGPDARPEDPFGDQPGDQPGDRPEGDGGAPAPATPRRGRLRVVATPIGNLGDLSPRAREAFEGADLVACEDTRHTGRLLAGEGIDRPLLSLHEHNERQRVPQVLEALESGQDVALASDAGTPLLSDPGFVLVRAAAEAGVVVEAIPGPSAILAALVASALPPYPFTFVGFPPPKGGKRRKFYRRFADLDHTLVVFESPHRLLASLQDALAELGERPAAVARELTKLHEEVLRGDLSEVRDELAARDSLKGEFVLVIGKPA